MGQIFIFYIFLARTLIFGRDILYNMRGNIINANTILLVIHLKNANLTVFKICLLLHMWSKMFESVQDTGLCVEHSASPFLILSMKNKY